MRCGPVSVPIPANVHPCIATLPLSLSDKTVTDYLMGDAEPLTKGKGHQPYEVRSWIATGLFFTVLMNIGLVVAVAKHCKCLMKVWLVQAAVWCVMGVYLTILNTFGSRVPLYGSGALSVLGVMLYVFFMGLVAIFHEVGNRLDTHSTGSTESLI